MSDISVDAALLALKIAFLVLLYLFIWRIVRSASRDFRSGGGAAQESVLIAPAEAAALGLAPQRVPRSPRRGEEPGTPARRGDSRRFACPF